ncbi:hypothetical protein BJ165DRAFT_1463409 [Panaeolus papilionaceus]|nr:hypothetical protein BJ165DRAFT_1463409 [Panaeolus papilionaceus]
MERSVLAQICLLGHVCATQPFTRHLHTYRFPITLFLYSHHGALALSSARGSSLYFFCPPSASPLNRSSLTQAPQLARPPSRSRWIAEVCG